MVLSLGACAAPDLSPRGESPVALAALPTPEPTPQPRFPQRQPVDEGRPVKVKSKALRYDNQNQETVFYGGVTVTQDTTKLLAQELRSADGGRNARASGGVLVTDEARHLWAQAGQADYADLMREASFSGGLRLLSIDPYGAPLTVTGQEGRYWGLSQAAKVEGGVQVWRGALSATAQSAELDEGGERLRLLGGVIADLGASRARSREATLGSADRSLLLSGGVRAHLLPKELRQAAAQPWSITPTAKETE